MRMSTNECAKCGCDLTGADDNNCRSPYDEDVCWWCDNQPMLTDEVVSEMERTMCYQPNDTGD